MTKILYISSNNLPADVEKVLKLAGNMLKANPSLNVALYGDTQQIISNFLGGVNNVTADYKNNTFSYNSQPAYSGDLATKRICLPASKSDYILITFGLDDAQLQSVEDNPNVSVFVVVVEDFELPKCENWLKLHAAIDLTTGNYIVQPTPIPDMAKRAIGKLINEGKLFLNLGNFPRSLPYIKRQANVLAKNGIKVSYEGVFQNCIERGLNHTVSRKIAETFAQAQIRLHKDSGNTNYSAVWDELHDKPVLARETV